MASLTANKHQKKQPNATKIEHAQALNKLGKHAAKSLDLGTNCNTRLSIRS